MLRYGYLILIAFFIDGLQALISLAFLGIGGAPFSIPVIGTAVGATTLPIGIAIGFAVNFTISVTVGTGLIMLLAFNGMFHPTRVIPAYLGETAPGFANLPVWTGLVLWSLHKKNKKEKLEKLHEAIA